MVRRSPKKIIHWRAQVVAAEHGVLSNRALFLRLAPLGLNLSESQLARIYGGQPKRLNVHLLALLCEAFNVTPGDLLVLVDRPRQSNKVVQIGAPKSGSRTDVNKLIGPAVPPIPEGRWRS